MGAKTVQNMEELARLANVSKSTVSRALNDSPLIKLETRERIKALASEHKFCINNCARNLSRRQSNTIAFVTHAYHSLFTVEDLFGLEILGGISNGLYALNYDLLVIHVNPRDTSWAHQYLDSGKVDGFILLTSIHKQSHINALIEMDAPFIAWGVPPTKSKYCSICGDDYKGGKLATEHLISIGRKKIAFLGGPPEELEVKERFTGYETALKNTGCSPDSNRIAYGDYSHTSGSEAMLRLLAQAPDLDAVFVNSDLMAVGAINAIQNSGRRVPDDVAVVGYDDLSIASFNNLPLTTVKQNIPLIGKLLGQNLVQYIQTHVVTNVTTPVELIVRKSA